MLVTRNGVELFLSKVSFAKFHRAGGVQWSTQIALICVLLWLLVQGSTRWWSRTNIFEFDILQFATRVSHIQV
jgi:hypothetical protein